MEKVPIQRYASIERGYMPDGSFGKVIEVHNKRVRIDIAPQDTVAVSPDDAAEAASLLQHLSNETEEGLAFKVEYSA